MCGLDLEAQPRLLSPEEYLALRRDEQWRAAHAERSAVWAAVPPVAWVAGVLLVGMIAGGFGPWATAFGIVSINGTRGDGWIVIGAAALGLAALVLWLRRRDRWWLLLVLWACGLTGTGVAGYALNELRQVSDQEFFGERVSLVSPAWGVYAALCASALLALGSVALLIDTPRRRRSAGLRALIAVVGAVAVLNGAGGIVLAAAPVHDDRGNSTATEEAASLAQTSSSPTAAPDPIPIPGTADVEPVIVSNDDVQTVLDLYAAGYDAEDTESLSALFASDFERRNADDPPQDRQAALGVYRKQFGELKNPQYVLSHVEVRQASSQGAAADARYSITSDVGTVRGSITFELVREGGQLLIAALDVRPD